ncbi:hypothetical protein BJX76DRAFT_334627 [Aspergillus varians]
MSDSSFQDMKNWVDRLSATFETSISPCTLTSPSACTASDLASCWFRENLAIGGPCEE